MSPAPSHPHVLYLTAGGARAPPAKSKKLAAEGARPARHFDQTPGRYQNRVGPNIVELTWTDMLP